MNEVFSCYSCNGLLREMNGAPCPRCGGSRAKPSGHGGRRKGAGRKPLPPGEGKVKRTIGLTREDWALLDSLRGDASRPAYLAMLLREADG